MKKRGVKALKASAIKLNARKFGLSAGIILGVISLLVSLAGKWLPVWDAILLDAYASTGILRTIYIAVIAVNPLLWSLIAGIYSFIIGFVVFWLFAKTYNSLK